MRTTCSQCNEEFDKCPVEPNSSAVINGICENCKKNLFCQTDIELRKYLDALPVPMILVDPEKGVKIANQMASAMLGKKLPDIEGYLMGIVFECKFAELPGGCGRTTHCSGCTIRLAVTETYATGNGFHKIRVFVNQEERQIPLLISTEKIGEFVFIRIDEVRS